MRRTILDISSQNKNYRAGIPRFKSRLCYSLLSDLPHRAAVFPSAKWTDPKSAYPHLTGLAVRTGILEMDLQASKEGYQEYQRNSEIPGRPFQSYLSWEGRSRVAGGWYGHRCWAHCVIFIFPGVGCLAGP